MGGSSSRHQTAFVPPDPALIAAQITELERFRQETKRVLLEAEKRIEEEKKRLEEEALRVQLEKERFTADTARREEEAKQEAKRQAKAEEDRVPAVENDLRNEIKELNLDILGELEDFLVDFTELKEKAETAGAAELRRVRTLRDQLSRICTIDTKPARMETVSAVPTNNMSKTELSALDEKYKQAVNSVIEVFNQAGGQAIRNLDPAEPARQINAEYLRGQCRVLQ